MTSAAFTPGSKEDPGVKAVAARALELVDDGARIGLGSGRAAMLFLDGLAARVRDGLRVSAVPTSLAVANAAMQAGIPLIELGTGGLLDLTVDGADEVTPWLDLVKGWGGALVRERIVATCSARQIILVSEHKLVRRLGERGHVPVEIIPLAAWLVTRELTALDIVPTRRLQADSEKPFVTDNGNWIVDCVLSEPLADTNSAQHLQSAICAITGVVDTGLFLGTASMVLVGHTDGRVDVHSHAPASKTRHEATP
ncbi:MAG: ribose-5-phosphate isomerase RpiA [Gemmatimonadaceae bacterium]